MTTRTPAELERAAAFLAAIEADANRPPRDTTELAKAELVERFAEFACDFTRIGVKYGMPDSSLVALRGDIMVRLGEFLTDNFHCEVTP